MVESIRIEPPDAPRAAYLMQQFVGLFPAILVQKDDRRWEIVIESEAEPAQLLAEVLRVLQTWADRDEANTARITLGDREYTVGGNRGPMTSPAGPCAAANVNELVVGFD